jgi:hypothetical protein
VIASTVAGINGIRQHFIDKLLNEIKQQCKKLRARSSPSVLRKTGFSGMTEFDWQKLISEMSTKCPLLLDVILAAMNHAPTEATIDIAPRIGMCYAIMMQARNHELSLVQRMNTILLVEGNARKKVIILIIFLFIAWCRLLVVFYLQSIRETLLTTGTLKKCFPDDEYNLVETSIKINKCYWELLFFCILLFDHPLYTLSII